MPSDRRPAPTPSRRPPSRNHRLSSRSRARKPRLYLHIAVAATGLLLAIFVWAILARITAPRANTARQTFDAILVLGSPADSDGNPTPQLQDRINEAVREYNRGVAPRLILTGGAAHNHYVEAEIMARAAHAQGVPTSAIIEEPRALDTIQNACFSARILAAHHWNSVEVISAPSHLPRAAMIFSRLAQDASPKLEWRTHPAPETLTPAYYSKAASVVEIPKTVRYLLLTRWAESCPA